jgi:UDP-N-acetylmuramoyl-tripeptide--D-alanyl-D-alanine ligase
VIPTTVAAVAEVTGAQLVGGDGHAVVAGDVEVDSRLVRPGALFVALAGERTDGHDHVAQAVAAGAVAALTSRPVAGQPCLVVPDPLVALQALAAHVFAQDQPRTFGVTGSSGKTSTKDLLAQLLGEDVLAPVGSFNNELGLPLTLLRRTAATRAAVLEYSARGVGHIAFLTGLARPHVALALNVGSAHLGEFGSVEAIAQAKGELVEAAVPYGDEPAVVVLNGDDPRVLAMRDRAPAGARVVVVGTGPQAEVRADDVVLDDGGRASFLLRAPQGEARVGLRLVGEHHVGNALSAAAAALLVEDLATVAARLEAAGAVSRWRMEVTERADGVTVVNDAYNANPDSMRSALKTLQVMGRGKQRRTVAVLGPMAELGDGARDAHMDLGRFLVRLDVGQLVVVGPDAGGIHAGAVLEGSWGSESVHVDDVDAAVALLREQLRPGDVVLVKASRSAGLERVAAALLEDA